MYHFTTRNGTTVWHAVISDKAWITFINCLLSIKVNFVCMFVCLFPLAFTNHLTIFTEHALNFKLLCCLFSLYIFFTSVVIIFVANIIDIFLWHRKTIVVFKIQSLIQISPTTLPIPSAKSFVLLQWRFRAESRILFFFFFSITLEINNGVTSN